MGTDPAQAERGTGEKQKLRVYAGGGGGWWTEVPLFACSCILTGGEHTGSRGGPGITLGFSAKGRFGVSSTGQATQQQPVMRCPEPNPFVL